ncbi:membrane protein [Myxococcus fulvus 124B02]|nr:membrane protein [Myxococcus fulvus 124B02]
MAEAVYILCALTSVACAVLLLRAWKRSQSRLLLWSGLCFVGMAVSNVMLFIDLVVLPTTIDLYMPRQLATLASASVLLYGLIWDAS